MHFTFHGAARTVTGSKHLITLKNGKKILLDCGMFQGLGPETEDLNEDFGFDPSSISCLILSHAHIDHTGLIPKLTKEGFSGNIYCTQATLELTELLLHDSAEIQTYERESINRRRSFQNKKPYEPLYTTADVDECLKQFQVVDYDRWIKIDEEVEFLFTNAGHLIGSAAVNINIKEDGETLRVLFSGDVGKYRSVLLQQPVEPEQADYIILESTYGDKHHDISFNTIESLYDWIQKICVQRRGQIVIPAFSVGRTQEVLYALNQLSLEKRLPDIPVFIDSPLSLKATQTIKKYTDQFNERLQKVLLIDDDPFEFPGLKYVESIEDSKKLVEFEEPCVIVSASGTADAGRVRHHIRHVVQKKNCAIVFVGYCGPHSLGGILTHGARHIELFGEEVQVRSEIGQIHGMSAHGDADDLIRFLAKQDPQKVRTIYLVHGEATIQQTFCERLKSKGFPKVEVPAAHEDYVVHERKMSTVSEKV